MTTLRLALPTPYDWATVVGYFVPRAIPGVELATEHHYWRTLVIGGRPGTLSVHVDTGSRLVASVETGARVSRREVEVALRRMFDLDADIEAVRQRLGRDARIARRLERCPGLRVVGGWDPFELSIRAILGQQVSVAAATPSRRAPGAKMRGADRGCARCRPDAPVSDPDPARHCRSG